MLEDLVEKIFEALEPHSSPNLPIQQSTIRQLNKSNLEEFYLFLRNIEKHKPVNKKLRPKCPIKDIKHVSLARYPYKKAMTDYINEWGYKFENPAAIPCSLLEATANYLEHL